VHKWSRHFGGSLGDGSLGLGIDGSGNATFTGYFEGTVDFGGGGLTSAGSIDIFLAKYSANGAHIWSQSFGDTLMEFGSAVCADDAGNVIATGYFNSTVDFGGGGLTSAGSGDIFLAKYNLEPDGSCYADYLPLAPTGVVPTTVAASFEERGVYITALQDFEICALGMMIELDLPQEVTARIYEADGTTRGTLVSASTWKTYLPDEVVHFVPVNFLFQACQDYEITFEFKNAPTWSWYDERTFSEPFDVGGVIRVRDGDYAGDASNFALPHFVMIGAAVACPAYSDLTPPGVEWSPYGDSLIDRGIYVTANQTMTVCGLEWEADFPDAPVPIAAKIYEAAGTTRGDLIALGVGVAATSGMTPHHIPINAVLREGMDYDLVVESPAADWAGVSKNTITLPYVVDDAFLVYDGEQGGSAADSLLVHLDVSWSHGTGGAPFDLRKQSGPYPPPFPVSGGSVRQGIYVTSLIEQNVYSLGWKADVPPGTTIYARVFKAGGTTRGALISEGSVMSAAAGMRWHDIPVAVTCSLGVDYDFEIQTSSTNEWRWWNDETGLPYDVHGVIRVRDGEQAGDPLNVGLVELRMNACDAVLTAVMDPVQPPKLFVGTPYPNPTAATTTIEYNLDRAGPVTIAVYDVAGRRVKTLLSNTHRQWGPGVLEFDAGALATGVYFVRISTPYKSVSRKVTIVR
jgi:hypothetical protein